MHRHIRGFTLVELLVVVAIIGMLLALLIPAVVSATNSARALQCRNRLKQLALATASYEARGGGYPGYVNSIELAIGNERAVSWALELMPGLERSNLLEQWQRADVSAADLPRPFLEFLACPSDPPLNRVQAWTSYAVNAGHADHDVPGCGVFHSHFPRRDANYRFRKKFRHAVTTLDTVSSGDGASQTILLSENIQATTWDSPAFVETVHRTSDDNIHNDIPDKKGVPHNVIVWHDTLEPSDAMILNGKPASDIEHTRPSADVARPSSFHRGGANVAFCDGRVQFLNESITYNVYARLLSHDGKKCWTRLRERIDDVPIQIDHRVPITDAY